jgi:hypothetical protein
MEIKNVNDLVSALKELGNPERGYTRFFRGHSKLSYQLKPSIYRPDEKNSPSDPDYLIKNENNIIRDVVINCPDAFNSSDTLFEKLVKLQHYGYATRLLDLTSNALVALYFACSEINDNDEDGELVILDIPDSDIKYDDSDVVSILSAISLRKSDFNIKNYINFSKQIADLEKQASIIKNNKLQENVPDDVKNVISKVEDNLSLPFRELIDKANNEIYENKYKETFNKQPEIARLLHDIRKDKPSFSPVIEPIDFNRVVCVKAKLNNPRIIRQQGSFLLFGIHDQKIDYATVPNHWKKMLKQESILIKNNCKKDILEALKYFGISKQNLFPELDSQAREIMDKYQIK